MDQTAESKASHKGRIIIRNLVFDINEKMLRKLMSKFGEIIDINIPLNPKNNKSYGYAFVEYSHKNNALKAINDLNDTKYKGRTILLDLSVGKQTYEKKIKEMDNE
mmetsp:Transcript_467/g.434  ORF Transcript_467/g.434 Transcript_467/m.434 type:complete len:106 (-) Transcript_467:342-659(-)